MTVAQRLPYRAVTWMEMDETYKVCCYDSEFDGRFHPHRDTPHPYSHRRYAFVLALNDEFEGGGLRLPEYGDKLYVPPVRSAIIFPCMCYHEVVPIKTGKRFADFHQALRLSLDSFDAVDDQDYAVYCC